MAWVVVEQVAVVVAKLEEYWRSRVERPASTSGADLCAGKGVALVGNLAPEGNSDIGGLVHSDTAAALVLMAETAALALAGTGVAVAEGEVLSRNVRAQLLVPVLVVSSVPLPHIDSPVYRSLAEVEGLGGRNETAQDWVAAGLRSGFQASAGAGVVLQDHLVQASTLG